MHIEMQAVLEIGHASTRVTGAAQAMRTKLNMSFLVQSHLHAGLHRVLRGLTMLHVMMHSRHIEIV
jgi:hypothetical protein